MMLDRVGEGANNKERKVIKGKEKREGESTLQEWLFVLEK